MFGTDTYNAYLREAHEQTERMNYHHGLREMKERERQPQNDTDSTTEQHPTASRWHGIVRVA